MPNAVCSTAVDSLRIAQFNGNPVRIISTDNLMWFVAADVMKCLGVRNTTTAVQHIHQEETRMVPLLGQRPVNALSERGLRKRLMRSRKPEAQALLEWIECEATAAAREATQAETQSKPDAFQRLAVRVAQLEQQLARSGLV